MLKGTSAVLLQASYHRILVSILPLYLFGVRSNMKCSETPLKLRHQSVEWNRQHTRGEGAGVNAAAHLWCAGDAARQDQASRSHILIIPYRHVIIIACCQILLAINKKRGVPAACMT